MHTLKTVTLTTLNVNKAFTLCENCLLGDGGHDPNSVLQLVQNFQPQGRTQFKHSGIQPMHTQKA